MQLWADGRVGQVFLEDDTELKVLTCVDDHSPFCVAAGPVSRATSAVCAVLSASLSRYGIPNEILTDNGKVFTRRTQPWPRSSRIT